MATEQGRDGGVLLISLTKREEEREKRERGVALIAVNNGTMGEVGRSGGG